MKNEKTNIEKQYNELIDNLQELIKQGNSLENIKDGILLKSQLISLLKLRLSYDNLIESSIDTMQNDILMWQASIRADFDFVLNHYKK